MAFTKEQKKEYYKELRQRWLEAKKSLTAGRIAEIEAIIITHGMNISSTGFQIVAMEMKQHGFDGLPYLDAKTYKGWLESGFRVKKGEKSVLGSITWIGIHGKSIENGDAVDKKGFMMPKAYKLFHRSQVEAA